MYKRKRLVVFIAIMLVLVSSVALAAESYKNYSVTYTNDSTFSYVISDTTSKATCTRARNKLSSAKYGSNNTAWTGTTPFKISDAAGNNVSERTSPYWIRPNNKTVYMYYASSPAAGARIYLQARPDNSLTQIKLTGSFGAG